MMDQEIERYINLVQEVLQIFDDQLSEFEIKKLREHLKNDTPCRILVPKDHSECLVLMSTSSTLITFVREDGKPLEYANGAFARKAYH